MGKSDYMYTIDFEKGFIQIVDLDKGGVSVTNNIEEVISEIAQKEGIDVVTFDVIYRDSAGIWDGWDPILHEYIILNAQTMDEAKDLYDIKLA